MKDKLVINGRQPNKMRRKFKAKVRSAKVSTNLLWIISLVSGVLMVLQMHEVLSREPRWGRDTLLFESEAIEVNNSESKPRWIITESPLQYFGKIEATGNRSVWHVEVIGQDRIHCLEYLKSILPSSFISLLHHKALQPCRIAALVRALTSGVEWVYVTQTSEMYVEALETLTVDKKREAMVVRDSGLFYPCRHLVCHIVTSEDGTMTDQSEDGHYTIRELSRYNAFTFVPSDPCGKYHDEWSPPVYTMPGTIAAINPQNLLMHKKLLWLSVIMMIDNSDLAYSVLNSFIQRLLWETEHGLGMMAPPFGFINQSEMTSSQNKTSDWSDIENGFYERLSTARCQNFFTSFRTCSFELLGKVLPDNETQHVSDLIYHWFDFLHSVKYQFPSRVAVGEESLEKKTKGIQAVYTPPKLTPVFHIKAPSDTSDEHCETKKSEERTGLQKEKTHRKRDLGEPAKGENLFTRLCQKANVSDIKIMVPEDFPIKDVTLVIVFNFPYYTTHIPMLLAMYGRHFKHIVFCGEYIPMFEKYRTRQHSIKVTFVEINHMRGHWGYSCLSAAVRMGFNTSGYLQMGDDVLLNVWEIENLPLDRPWFQSKVRVADVKLKRLPDIATTNRWYPWIFGSGQRAAVFSLRALLAMVNDGEIGHKVRQFLKRLEKTTKCEECLMYEAADIFYVPHRLKDDYIIFADIFHGNWLHLELAVPTTLFGLADESEVVRLRGDYLWGEDARAEFLKYYSLYDHFQHSWKLTKLTTPEAARFFCKVYLPRINYNVHGFAKNITEV